MHLFSYLYYWQMGFNSVFKGLSNKRVMGVAFVIVRSQVTLLSYSKPWQRGFAQNGVITRRNQRTHRYHCIYEEEEKGEG